MPIEGNAAGNTIDWFDLKGQLSPPRPLPAGFTSRGVIALVFSIISGMLGTVVIIWYAYGDLADDSEVQGANGNGSQYAELVDDSEHDEDVNCPASSRTVDETASLLH